MDKPDLQALMDDLEARLDIYPPEDSSYTAGWLVEAVNAEGDSIGIAGGETEENALNAMAWVLFNLFLDVSVASRPTFVADAP